MSAGSNKVAEKRLKKKEKAKTETRLKEHKKASVCRMNFALELVEFTSDSGIFSVDLS